MFDSRAARPNFLSDIRPGFQEEVDNELDRPSKGSACRERLTWAACTSVTAVLLSVGSLALLLDFAISRRSVLEVGLMHPWWGHADRGCWLGTRGCRSRSDPSIQATKDLLVQPEPRGDASVQACEEQAINSWYDCVEEEYGGMVAATYRPTGFVDIRPSSAESDPELYEEITVQLTASPRLLRPGSNGWILRFCSRRTGFCSTLDAHAFCEDWDIEHVGHRWALRAGCKEVVTGRWPQCDAGEGFAVCGVAHEDGEAFKSACESSCPIFKHMHNLIVVGLLGLLLLCTITLWACMFGWCRHMGFVTVVIALLTCGSLAIALILSLVNDLVSVAITHAAPLHIVEEQRPMSGVQEAAWAVLLLLLVPVAALSAAKNERIDRYRRRRNRSDGAAHGGVWKATSSARTFAAQRWGRARNSTDGEEVPIMNEAGSGGFESVLPQHAVHDDEAGSIATLDPRPVDSAAGDRNVLADILGRSLCERDTERASEPAEDSIEADVAADHESELEDDLVVIHPDRTERGDAHVDSAEEEMPTIVLRSEASSSDGVDPGLVRIMSLSDVESEGQEEAGRGSFAIAPLGSVNSAPP